MSKVLRFLLSFVGALLVLAAIGFIFEYLGGYIAVGLGVITPIALILLAIFCALVVFVIVLTLFGYSVDSKTYTITKREEITINNREPESRSSIIKVHIDEYE